MTDGNIDKTIFDEIGDILDEIERRLYLIRLCKKGWDKTERDIFGYPLSIFAIMIRGKANRPHSTDSNGWISEFRVGGDSHDLRDLPLEYSKRVEEKIRDIISLHIDGWKQNISELKKELKLKVEILTKEEE